MNRAPPKARARNTEARSDMAGEEVTVASLFKNLPVSVQKVGESGKAEGDRMAAQLLGGIEKTHLILGNFRGGTVDKGDELIVRLATGMIVVGFRTRVLDVVEGPIRLFFTAIPGHMEALSLRKSDRLAAFIPADLHLRYGAQKNENFHLLQGMIVDLSRGGCQVSTKNPIDLNTEVRMSFSLPGDKNLFRVDGRVVRTRQKDGVYALGVQFQRETENLPALVELSQWLTQHLVYSVGT